MGAGHDHSHGGGHARQPDGHRRGDPDRRSSSLELTTALMINSIALLADAGHMLTDLVAMFMGLTAVLLARRGSASAARTYGWHRAEVFTAVANAVLLLGVGGFILYEAFERLGDAPEVPGVPMIVVALAGLVANAVVVLLLRSHSESSLAVKGAYMEVVADTVGSIGVLIAGIVTVTTRWPYADVVVAVLVALWVLPRAIALARAALRILSRVVAQPHRRRRTAHRAVRRRRRHRGARPARVDAGAGQGHGHRAPDQQRRLGRVLEDAQRGARRARAGARDGAGRAARTAPRLRERQRNSELAQPSCGTRRRDRSRRADPGSAGTRRVSPIESAARASAATQRRKPRFGSCANRAPGRSPSSRCGAADQDRGDSRCGRRRRR